MVSERFKKPRPRPPKAEPACRTLTVEEREALAADAIYVGSPHHTEVPKYGLSNQPRDGAMTIEEAEALGLKNPSCLVCPVKWVRRQAQATELLRKAIREGAFVGDDAKMKPGKIWARDPDDPNIVYEAKILSQPPNGYKAYPLTTFQAKYLPFELP
jgi:hypothetical protein